MKAIKRTVAALLATLMLATSTSFVLAAEEYSDKEAVVVAKVNAAGIMTGTDKGFEPSKSLTRAEAAAIIVRMKGISESAVKTMAGTTLFNDVAASHWASGYVNEASNLGIVKGVSATEFAPDREVTVAEFVTMAVRALGAGQLVDSEGVWPTNYINFANENDLLKDVTAIYTATASRMNAATIVANTLVAPMWEKSGVKSNGEITWSKALIGYSGDDAIYKTMLKSVLNIETDTVTFTASDIDIKNRKLVNDDVAETVDMATIKAGIEYDTWYNTKDQEIVGVWESEDSKQNSFTFTEIAKKLDDNSKVTLKIDGKDMKYKVITSGEDATRVFYNGIEYTTDQYDYFADSDENIFGTVVVKGNDIDVIYLEQYNYIKLVDEVTSDKIKFDAVTTDSNYNVAGGNFTASSIKYTDEDNTFYVTRDGKEIKVTDIEEGDVLFFYVEADGNNDIFHIDVVNNDITGEVQSKGTTYVKIDGKKYTKAEGLSISDIDPEEEWTLYLNKAGKIVAIEEVEGTSEYAVIRSMEAYNDRKGTNIEFTLVYADGSVSEVLPLDLDSDDLSTIKATLATAAPADVNSSVEGITKGWDVFVLGALVEYEIKGDKLVDITPVVDGDDTKVQAADWNDTDDVWENGASLTIGKTKSYATVDNVKYYIDKNTDILVVKAGSKDYEVKVSKVAFEDLDTSSNLSITVADIDDNNNVKLVVIDQTKGSKAKNSVKSDDWAIVLEVASTKSGDYEYEYVLASANGETETYYTEDEDYHLGDLGVFSFAENEITDVDKEDYASILASASALTNSVTDADKMYISSIEDGVMTIANIKFATGTTTYSAYGLDTFEMSDDVLFIKHDSSKSTLTLTKEPDFAKDEDSTLDIKDAKAVEYIYFEEVDTGIYEVIAVIYAK